MAQTLTVKKTINGKETMSSVEILRSWSESSGRHGFLDMGGLYGYKNGAAIKCEGELNIIPEGAQRDLAKSWWRRVGKKLSEEFYASEEEKFKVLAGDFSEEAPLDNADLDNILYARYEANDPRPESLEPCPWSEFFKERPDWWGQANSLSFNDWIYEKHDPAKKPPEPEIEEQKTETSESSEKITSPDPDPDTTGPDAGGDKNKEF